MLFINLNASIGLHQAALADALYRVLGKDYVFIEFGRIKHGQHGGCRMTSKGVDYYKDRPYILKMHESEENALLAKELLAKADVVRTGGEPHELIRQRLIDKKLTFRSTEHVLKGPKWKDVFRIRGLYPYMKYSNPNYRVLCQSAYMANDLNLLGNMYHEKCYKFAYFTQVANLDIDNIIAHRAKEKIKMMWCARFLDWKHPELVLKLAKKLITSGRTNFEIQMVGANATPLWKEINEQVQKENLGDYVILTGGIPNTEVLERMRQSHIFLFTSDRGEGWGAVLNEAMSAGCACVASHEIGSVPFLLKHKQNGLIFKSCSADSLYENVAYLYDNPSQADIFGRNAYQTITTEWSAQNAAERLVKLSESILSGHEIEFEDGPCSKSYPISADKLIR